jgi:hypothetical protein
MPVADEERRRVLEEREQHHFSEVEAILEKASDELLRDRDLVLAAAAIARMGNKSAEGAAIGMAAELGADREFVLQRLERAEAFRSNFGYLSKQDEEFTVSVCGIALALLCSPEDEHQAMGAKFAARGNVHAVPESVLRRLVELLSSGADKAQQTAARALAPTMEDAQAKEQVLQTVRESADATDLLAVLAYSSSSGGNTRTKQLRKDLAKQARLLLESAEPGAKDKKRQKEMMNDGLAVLFSRHKQQGWTEPDPAAEWGETTPNGESFTSSKSDGSEPEPQAGYRVFVEGHGQGKVYSFNKTKVPGMHSTHKIIFDDVSGAKDIKLRRKGNDQTRWLLPPKGMDVYTGKTDEIVWKARGGRRLDPQRPRDARVDDVCLWMHQQGGVLRFYAGLFGWVRLRMQSEAALRTELEALTLHKLSQRSRHVAAIGKAIRAQALQEAIETEIPKAELIALLLKAERDTLKTAQPGIDGDQLLRLTDEMLREQLYIHVKAHREALLSAIAPLRGFLGRYRLGRFLHRSATCIVLIALDELNGDQEVLLKLMRHRSQFESEITCRFSDGKRLDAAYVIGIRCWHTPSAEPFVDEAGKPQETESTDSAPADMAAYKYVLNTHVAKHDLANDILHGRYAGRDKPRVQRLLRQVVLCLWYCEQHNFVHCDIKCAQHCFLPRSWR